MVKQRHVPARIGVRDVVGLEEEIERLRGMDYRLGGGACRDAVIVTAAWSDQWLRAKSTAAVRTRLVVALGDLHNLAGWTCFDTGLDEAATRHWDRALELAAEAGHDGLVANIHYRSGRMRLHNARRRDALDVFERGVMAAERARSRHAVAMLRANEAWAHAGLGDQGTALSRLRQAYEEFDRAAAGDAPAWAKFFDETDLSAMTGVVHTELARTVDPSHTATAIPALTTAVAGYPASMVRSHTFSLIALTANHLLDGDFDQADAVGRRAVEQACELSSTRVADRLHPLRHLADRYRGDPHARTLAARIAAFTPNS